MNANSVCECIYCRRHLPLADFNTEHVLSVAFGKFAKAPVLHNSVCRECNQFFGDNLEMRVSRGAFEGMLRYQRSTKVPDAGILNLRYVEFAIPEGSDWSGVRLILAWRDGKLLVDLLTQVAFFDTARSQWVHVTEMDIVAGALSRTPTLETNTVRIYARSLADRERILRLLEKNGITFRRLDDMPLPAGMFDGGDISVEVTFTINKGIRRCMAKYSFNFLAFVCDASFVLDKDFDVIRRFIRYGDTPAYPVVAETLQPILRGDSTNLRHTSGHLLTVEWPASGKDLIGQVSLFNSITYRITLAHQHRRTLWRPIRSGLHFNIRDKIVQPLLASSALFLP